MSQIFEKLIGNPHGIMFIITGLSAAGILIAAIKGRRDLQKAFSGISKATLIILVLLSALYLCFLITGWQRGFVPSDEEWFNINQAKNILNGNLKVFAYSPKGVVYDLVIASLMMVFGKNEHAAIIVNALCAALTVALVGLTAYLIFKKNGAGVAASIGYSSLPLVIKFSGFTMGYPAFGAFFMALFAFFGAMVIRTKSVAYHVGMWLTVALASETKPEFFALVIPAIAVVIMAWGIRPNFKNKIAYLKYACLIIAIVVAFIPFFTKNYQLNRNIRAANGVTGMYLSQKTNQPPSIIDKILKPILNDRFSFDYFVGDVDNFVSFLTSLQKGTFIGVILLGIAIYATQKNKNKIGGKLLLFTAISTLGIATPYMAADVVFDMESGRFAFYTIPFISIAFGAMLITIFEYFRRKLPLYLAAIPLLILPAYAANALFVAIPNAAVDFYDIGFTSSIRQVKEMIKNPYFNAAENIIYAKQNNLTDFLRFNGYDSYALSSLIKTSTSRDPEVAAAEMRLPDWDSKKNKIIIITSTDDIMTSTDNGENLDPMQLVNVIIKKFIEIHRTAEIPLNFTNIRAFRLE
ncbi:MAG: glycosyltransferase family 39 protein [Patescibacteria group bacterium]|nr:glycosyltransferase family 39 protein [Patescibacteria group bacterium]MCL5261767.1 glycosyltransferase family 39 protein [Patescibacteria group bacterium]